MTPAESHQQELERRRREEDELLANDPAYLKWIEEIEQLDKDIRHGHDEVRRVSIERPEGR